MLFPIGDDNSSERTVPVVTYALIALNVLVFFLELSSGEPFIQRWSVVPRRLIENPGSVLLSSLPCSCMAAGCIWAAICFTFGFLGTMWRIV